MCPRSSVACHAIAKIFTLLFFVHICSDHSFQLFDGETSEETRIHKSHYDLDMNGVCVFQKISFPPLNGISSSLSGV